jgi:uncharacterized protein (TIGR02453 family)
MLRKETLQFLKHLKQHNNKDWFAAHRDQYEAAHQNFEELAAAVLKATVKFDPTVKEITPAKAVLRINRDLRFAKDKTPYHPAFRLSLSQDGKLGNAVGYFFHCEPGAAFAAGGLLGGTPADIKHVRQEIHYNWEEFRGLLHAKEFQAVFGDLKKAPEFSLKRPPRGYDEKDPAIEYLKLKVFAARHPLTEAELLADDLPETLIQAFKAVHPVLDFLNRDLK